MRGAPIESGAVLVVGDRVEWAGDFVSRPDVAGARIVDWGDSVLMPGLVNAHCHLDYTDMRGSILRPTSFTGWIRRINDLKRTLSDDDYVSAIEAGAEELANSGCTSVANIESFPEVLAKLSAPRIRVWWLLEVMDIRARRPVEPGVLDLMANFARSDGWLGGVGISPHAPYTASLGLYKEAAAVAAEYSLPWATHLAESREEFEMCAEGTGELHQFLSSIGADWSADGRGTPTAYLVDAGVVPPGGMLAHLNECTDGDLALLARLPGRPSVVHCPNTHAYFGREEFDDRRFSKAGIPLCLGTDSCASNRGLDLFSEMRTFRAGRTWLTPESILRMVTTNAADAMGQAGRIGELSRGAYADFLILEDTDCAADPYEAVLGHRVKPHAVFVGGRRLEFPDRES